MHLSFAKNINCCKRGGTCNNTHRKQNQKSQILIKPFISFFTSYTMVTPSCSPILNEPCKVIFMRRAGCRPRKGRNSHINAVTMPKIKKFIFGGYFSHPSDKICNIEQAFTLQSMEIFRDSFLFSRALFCIKGAKSPGAPCNFFPGCNCDEIATSHSISRIFCPILTKGSK